MKSNSIKRTTKLKKCFHGFEAFLMLLLLIIHQILCQKKINQIKKEHFYFNGNLNIVFLNQQSKF